MSTQLASLGPLCQAAIITFQPFSSFYLVSGAFLVFALAIKFFASILKTKLLLQKNYPITKTPPAAKRLLKKYNFPSKHLVIIDSPKLLAFSSVFPGIANGIFLSTAIFEQLNPQQQQAVFLHELYHWKSKATFFQLVFKLLAEVFFFLPILSDIIHHWQLESEIAADHFATNQLKSTAPLKQALSKWLNQENYAPAWTVSFAETQLAQRIEALNKKRKVKAIFGITLRSLVVSLLVVVGLVVVGISDYSQAEATLIIPTNSQCQRLWQQQPNQSEADAIMSPKMTE